MTNEMNTNNTQNTAAKAHTPNFSQVILMARLSADCNYKPAEGTRLAKVYFTLASNDGYLRSDGSEAVSYISCCITGKRADSLYAYLKKGVKVAVMGRLRTWSDKLPDGKYENNYVVDVEKLTFESSIPNTQNQQATQPVQQGQPMQQAPAMNPPMPNTAPQYQQPPMQQNPAPAMNQPMPQYQQPPMQQAPAMNQPAPQPQYQQAPMPQFQQQPAPQAQGNPFASAPEFAYQNNPFDNMGAFAN